MNEINLTVNWIYIVKLSYQMDIFLYKTVTIIYIVIIASFMYTDVILWR